MLKMLVVDDEYLVRLGIRETIDWSKYGIKIVGEASDGSDGLELALRYNPDIILSDIKMPLMDGLEFMGKIRENKLESSIIVFSGYDEFSYAKEAIKNGALAYILKPFENDQLVETVKTVAEKIKKERRTRQHYEKLEGEMSSIRKQFLLDLLTGNITDMTEIKEKMDFLKLPLKAAHNLVTVININQYHSVLHNIPYNEVRDINEKITERISLPSSEINPQSLVVNGNLGEWVVITPVTNGKKETVHDYKHKFYTLTKTIKDELKYSIVAGFCLCEDIRYINKAYIEASIETRFKLLSGKHIDTYLAEDSPKVYRREIREAIRFIKDNYSKDITVDMAASALFISPSYLMHLFKDEIKLTFNECLTNYRIEVAKELLKNSMCKIYEVSDRVGYGDAKYFSQVFKKVTGISPSDYVKHCV